MRLDSEMLLRASVNVIKELTEKNDRLQKRFDETQDEVLEHLEQAQNELKEIQELVRTLK